MLNGTLMKVKTNSNTAHGKEIYSIKRIYNFNAAVLFVYAIICPLLFGLIFFKCEAHQVGSLPTNLAERIYIAESSSWCNITSLPASQSYNAIYKKYCHTRRVFRWGFQQLMHWSKCQYFKWHRAQDASTHIVHVNQFTFKYLSFLLDLPPKNWIYFRHLKFL